jgi:hypothetical protein
MKSKFGCIAALALITMGVLSLTSKATTPVSVAAQRPFAQLE